VEKYSFSKRDREKKMWRGAVRDTTFSRGRNIFPALKVPKQSPLALLVQELLREGKALGSEKCNSLGCGLCYGQR
jgi:hypothetical protein